ncbi:hypothetical protein NDI56_06515 [Haloarcula sp. S1CR25-12]|uniref:Uncharacterized protein n=1 Tax=Haloarcula saliterrae TaxID=2950534 RepID=A0ABU2FA25_9EURY|nr:hypothetical protein [Haloarcula sp. S1CR25-12]MDS0259042.1 hypothetical protein [Haloarcula sp. S1CR25-12]
MGFQDWKWIGETEYFQQSEEKAYQGDLSLRIDRQRDYRTENMAVLKQSIDDEPSEARLETHFYSDGGVNSFGMVFRWQNEDNFYAVDGRTLTSGGRTQNIGLYKKINGQDNNITRIGGQNTHPDDDTWTQFRCTAFITEGDLHVRPEFRSPSGEWARYNDDKDLIDPDPELEDGGGVGMVFYNPSSAARGTDSFYLDQTRIYYDQ